MGHLPPYVLELIQRLIAREGGVSNKARDRGGFTNAGITLPTLSRYLGRTATPDDLIAMDDETAVNIYYTLFWLGLRVYKVFAVDPLFGEFILDWSVNSGPKAVDYFQHFLGCAQDGLIGDQTLGLLKDAIAKDPKVFGRFVDYRAHFVVNICVHDPSQLAEVQGWLNRIFAFRYLIPVAAS